MKLLLLVTLCFGQYLCSSPSYETNEDIEPYEEKFMYQYIDHFNYLGQAGKNGQFKMRYLVSAKHWKGKGPVLFYCGNEGSIDNFWNNTGFMFALAKELGGLVVFGEHRYYGKSLPYGSSSFNPKYIGFLSMEQTLADYAVLLKHIQKEYSTNNAPIFAMGGSYGGILAGYFRYKYPHIIAGAVASSAPYLTIAGNRPRHEFFHSVTKTFGKANPTCPLSVKQGFTGLVALLEEGNIAKVQKEFNLCAPQLKKTDFKINMLAWLRNAFTLLAMLDYPYPTNFMAKLPGHPVNLACSYMTSKDKVQGLAKITQLLYGQKATCHDTYAEYISCSDPTGCGTGPDNPPWDYQACTEIILPGGSNNATDMFPVIPFTLYMRFQYCQQRFGLGSSRESWLGTNYFRSLDDIKKASRIIFPNGDLDPWMSGGVLKDLSPSLIAITIEGGAHHLDLRSANKADPKSVVDGRIRITNILKKWMKEDGHKQI